MREHTIYVADGLRTVSETDYKLIRLLVSLAGKCATALNDDAKRFYLTEMEAIITILKATGVERPRSPLDDSGQKP